MKTRKKIKEIRTIKKEIRILGIDDAPYKRSKDKNVLVVGTIFRGGQWLDGLLSTEVKIDGDDSTQKLIELIKKTKHLGQLQCIMIDGISLGGFNVVDTKELAAKTGLPVIAVIRKRPNFSEIKAALKKMKALYKMATIKKAGKIAFVKIKGKKVYFQTTGLPKKKAAQIISLTATRSLTPEPLRVSHLIASGIILGESRGHA